MWAEFLGAAKHPPCALLAQFVTLKLMDGIILQQFPLPSADDSSCCKVSELTYLEENSLRYVAGYVIRAAKQKLKERHHPMMEILTYGLLEMCSEEDSSEDHYSTDDWLKTIDRGGLTKVNQKCYRFFYTMEMEIRNNIISTENETSAFEGLLAIICEDVDVVFFWSVCTQELSEEERIELLKIVASQYITVRGYSFARSILEKFKQRSQKTVQKSKGLRKEIKTD